MKKILIITPARVRESDLIETIRRVGCEVTLAPKTALPALDASGFDAVVISGGTESEPMTFTSAEREAADRLSRSGVRVFAEFCQYLGAYIGLECAGSVFRKQRGRSPAAREMRRSAKSGRPAACGTGQTGSRRLADGIALSVRLPRTNTSQSGRVTAARLSSAKRTNSASTYRPSGFAA